MTQLIIIPSVFSFLMSLCNFVFPWFTATFFFSKPVLLVLFSGFIILLWRCSSYSVFLVLLSLAHHLILQYAKSLIFSNLSETTFLAFSTAFSSRWPNVISNWNLERKSFHSIGNVSSFCYCCHDTFDSFFSLWFEMVENFGHFSFKISYVFPFLYLLL